MSTRICIYSKENLRGDYNKAETGWNNPYYERLIKLKPSEIASLYAMGVKNITEIERNGSWIWLGLRILLLIITRATASPSKENPNMRFIDVLIPAAVSFILWINNLGAKFISNFSKYKTYSGTPTGILSASGMPAIYKGDYQ